MRTESSTLELIFVQVGVTRAQILIRAVVYRGIFLYATMASVTVIRLALIDATRQGKLFCFRGECLFFAKVANSPQKRSSFDSLANLLELL